MVTSVSTATRLRGSAASMASRMESLIASQILSGCPSVTDSLVKSRLLTISLSLCVGTPVPIALTLVRVPPHPCIQSMY